MSFNPMGAKAVQIFRGGADRLGVWGQHLGSGCCDGAVDAPKVDRLVPTINPENDHTHTRPYGNKDNFRFSTLHPTEQRKVVEAINKYGVGTQIEAMVIPSFVFASTVHIGIHAEEPGLQFKLTTRNGTEVPMDQKIKIVETQGGVGCATLTRVRSTTDFMSMGSLEGGSAVYHIGRSNNGNFAVYADVYILEVVSVPAGGVLGYFDIEMHATYNNPGRSEAV